VREVFSPGLRERLSLAQDFPEEFATEAAKLGIDRETALNYWMAHWNLPSYEQLNQMRFRAGLTPEAYDEALRAIDIAPVWRPFFQKIAHAIPTISDFQRLVRRGIYGGTERQDFDYDAEYPQEFTEKMALHGLSEQDAKDLWAGGWKVVSATQLYKMLWRGEINETQLNKGLKALDYSPFWRDRLANIARPTLGRVDTRRMLTNEIITEQEARALFAKLGFLPEDIDRLVELAQIKPVSTEREATAADEASLYLAGRQTRPEYVGRLKGLGYSDAEAERKATVTMARFVVTATTGAVSTLHTLFKKGALPEAAARAALVALDIEPWAVDGVMARWKVELHAVQTQVTPAA